MLDKTPMLTVEAFRARRFKYATATSMVSKISTIAVQILAIPVAVRALGPEQFSIYAVLASTLAFFSMTNIGFGPALTVGIASARASDRTDIETKLLASAFFPVLALSAFIGLAISISILVLPIERIIAIPKSVSPSDVQIGLLIILISALLQSLLSIPEAAQGGYQELHKRNLWMSIGNGLSLVFMLLAAKYWPVVVGMIVAVRLPFTLAQFSNSIRFLRRNPHLKPKWSAFCPTESKSLLVSGFTVLFVTFGAYLNHQFPILMANRELGANLTASIAATFSAFILLFGMVSLVGFPLRPAIADSMARNDSFWAMRAYRYFLGGSTLYAGLVGVGMALVGPQILQVWVGGAIVFDRMLVLLMGVYFVLAVWENVHYVTLIGLGIIRVPGVLYLIRAVLSATIMVPLVNQWGVVGIPIALCFSVVLVTGLPLYLLTRQQLAQLSGRSQSLQGVMSDG